MSVILNVVSSPARVLALCSLRRMLLLRVALLHLRQPKQQNFGSWAPYPWQGPNVADICPTLSRTKTLYIWNPMLILHMALQSITLTVVHVFQGFGKKCWLRQRCQRSEMHPGWEYTSADSDLNLPDCKCKCLHASVLLRLAYEKIYACPESDQMMRTALVSDDGLVWSLAGGCPT